MEHREASECSVARTVRNKRVPLAAGLLAAGIAFRSLAFLDGQCAGHYRKSESCISFRHDGHQRDDAKRYGPDDDRGTK